MDARHAHTPAQRHPACHPCWPHAPHRAAPGARAQPPPRPPPHRHAQPPQGADHPAPLPPGRATLVAQIAAPEPGRLSVQPPHPLAGVGGRCPLHPAPGRRDLLATSCIDHQPRALVDGVPTKRTVLTRRCEEVRKGGAGSRVARLIGKAIVGAGRGKPARREGVVFTATPEVPKKLTMLCACRGRARD